MKFSKRVLSTFALGFGLAVATQAHADLIINVNGTIVATDPTNTFVSWDGAAGGCEINDLDFLGIAAFGSTGVVMDTGSLNVNSQAGSCSVTLLMIQTNLDLADGATFYGSFSGNIRNGTATRSFYLDDTNQGLLTTLMGTTSLEEADFSYTGAPAGLFSITQRITFSTSTTGGFLSSDDALQVPEPGTLALLGLGLAGLSLVRRRKH